MSGKKGRSGRRTKKVNEQIDVLGGRSIQWGIRNWKKFSDELKMRILLTLGPKYITEHKEITGDALRGGITLIMPDETKVDLSGNQT